MRFRRQTSTTGSRRWRVPALLGASVLVGTAITIGAAAPGAQADTPIRVTLGGQGVVSQLCGQLTNTVYALPGSTLTFVSDTTGLQLPTQQQVANLLGLDLSGGLLGGVLGTVNGILNSLNLNQVVTTVSQGNSTLAVTGVQPGQSSSYRFTSPGTYTLGYSTALPIQNKRLPLITNNPLTVVVSADARNCSLSVGANVPVNVPGLPSINVNVPGVGGVQVGSGSTPSASASSSSAAPAPAATTSTPAVGFPAVNYGAAGCGPCQVVPRGSGAGGRVGAASGVTLGDLNDPAAGSGSDTSGSASAGGAADAALVGANGGATQLAVDRAFTNGSAGSTDGPSGPTGLAIAAAAALGGVTVLWVARRRFARS